MTTIAPGQTNAAAMAQGAQALNNVAFQLANGIAALFASPLGAGPLAFGKLPEFLNIGCFCGTPDTGGQVPTTEPVANWTVQTTGQNTANVDLGDGYKLQIDERNSEMTIFNEKTGQTTRIWGDPHVDVNGQHKFDFWGTSTFTLENGTKLTINTEQWGGNPNAYVASQVVITKGDNAIVIDGISQNTIGDLKLTVSSDGAALDAAHRDGFTMHEAAGSTGWATEMGKQVTQTEANVTAVGGVYAPGSDVPSLAESADVFSSFLLFGQFQMAATTIDPVTRSETAKAEARVFRQTLLA